MAEASTSQPVLAPVLDLVHAPEPAPERALENAQPRRRWIAISAAFAAFSRPAAWVGVWAVELALAAAPALVWFGALRTTLDHHYAPMSMFRDLGTVFRFDQREKLGELDSSTALLGALLAVVAMLVSAFAAGGWLQLFLSGTRERGVKPFLVGGARFFGRFLRVMLLSIGLLALASWLVYGAPWDTLVLQRLMHVPAGDTAKLETLSSEQTVFVLHGVQAGLYALFVGLVFAWGDFTRTRVALFDGGSVVWAGLGAAATLLAHPIRALRPLLVLFAGEIVITFGLGLFAQHIEANAATQAEVAALFVIGQLVLVWRVILRGARYHAAVAVIRELVRPISKPDPWRWGRLPEPGQPNPS